jgi:hypothetical protein
VTPLTSVNQYPHFISLSGSVLGPLLTAVSARHIVPQYFEILYHSHRQLTGYKPFSFLYPFTTPKSGSSYMFLVTAAGLTPAGLCCSILVIWGY